MIEISTNTFIDTRTGKTMLQMTMKKDGTISSDKVEYDKLLHKTDAQVSLSALIIHLCDMVYKFKVISDN